jgi:hypothetical protein
MTPRLQAALVELRDATIELAQEHKRMVPDPSEPGFASDDDDENAPYFAAIERHLEARSDLEEIVCAGQRKMAWEAGQ